MKVEMEIDSNGVLLTTLSGEFDADDWIRQREAALAAVSDGLDLKGRPMVTDAVACTRPEIEWTTHVAKVCLYLETQSGYTGRRAYVKGEHGNVGSGLSFFVDLEHHLRTAPNELKVFENFDEAYAWATEHWPGLPDAG